MAKVEEDMDNIIEETNFQDKKTVHNMNLSGMFRDDGRAYDQLRNMKISMHCLKNSDGSACFEIGNTKVLATIDGPKDSEQKLGKRGNTGKLDIHCEISWNTFSRQEHRKNFGKFEKRNIERSLSLKNILKALIFTEIYSNSYLSVQVQILQSDGCEFPACINAVGLALIDAGIQLRGIITACSTSLVLPDTTQFKNKAAVNPIPALDPNSSEVKNFPLFTIATLEDSKVLFTQLDNSKVHIMSLGNIVSTCLTGCSEIREYFQDFISKVAIKKAALQFI